MPSLWLVAVAGVGVGVLYGVLGVGGAVVGTPVLSLLGVPAIMAVASPLPATVPAALVAAVSYAQRDELDSTVVIPAAAVAVPCAAAGALVSAVVGGGPLLVISGVVLGVVGLRLLRQPRASSRPVAAVGRRRVLVGACAAVAAFAAGLLANGGAALLVPLLILVVALDYRTAAGTALVLVPLTALPAVATHWALGRIDWGVAAAFGAGLVPAAALGGRLAGRFASATLQHALGWVLLAFAAAFILNRVVT